MAGLVPAIHALAERTQKSWMPGPGPGMTALWKDARERQGLRASKPALAPAPQHDEGSPHRRGITATASTSTRYSGWARASTPIQVELGGFSVPNTSASTRPTRSASGPERKPGI